MKRVGLVTCRNLPETDPDQDLLLQSLEGLGLHAEMLAWDDPNADPAQFDVCVLRSCWNYFQNVRAFKRWLRNADQVTRLCNPLPLLLWNLHKGYLKDLRDQGFAIPPTLFLDAGSKLDLRQIIDRNEWLEIVIKPAVSAGSYQTRKFCAEDQRSAQSFLNELVCEQDVLVQEYQPTVETEGEKVLIWIDGHFTHAVRKSARFAFGSEKVSEALSVTAEEERLGAKLLKTILKGQKPNYARIDLIPHSSGGYLISELELIEPSLYLLQYKVCAKLLSESIYKTVRPES